MIPAHFLKRLREGFQGAIVAAPVLALEGVRIHAVRHRGGRRALVRVRRRVVGIYGDGGDEDVVPRVPLHVLRDVPDPRWRR